MMTLDFVLVIVLLTGLVVAGLVLIWPTMHIVEEGRAVVIYRWGRVARFAGPGRVWTYGFAESIPGEPFDIRNRQVDVYVPGIMVNGIPTGITFGIWCRFDPVRTAGGDKSKWRELVLCGEAERGRRLQRQIQEVLPATLAAMAKAHPLPAPSNIVDQLLPLLPDTAENRTFRSELLRELWRTLPVLGLIPDREHQLVLVSLALPEALTRGFDRDRITAILRLKFPDLPDDRMAAMLSAIEGNQLPIKTFVFEGAKSQPKEVRFVEDDMEMLKGLDEQAVGTPAPVAARPAPPGARPRPAIQPAVRPVTKEDWAVLKPMPSYKKSQK